MSAVALFRRIFDYLDLPVDIAEPAVPVRLAAPRGDLRFEHVSMGYVPGTSTVEESVRGEARPDGRARRAERRRQDDDDLFACRSL